MLNFTLTNNYFLIYGMVLSNFDKCVDFTFVDLYIVCKNCSELCIDIGKQIYTGLWFCFKKGAFLCAFDMHFIQSAISSTIELPSDTQLNLKSTVG